MTDNRALALPDALNPLGMSELDVIGCRLSGHTGEIVAPVERPAEPRQVLEQILARLLAAGPCSLAFSGGRDSSALLAVAVQVARRQGLDPPLPVTVGYEPGVPSDEREWQELLLDHLKLDAWEHVDGSAGRMDFIGPVAQDMLRQHGLMHPPHTHMFGPMFERAPGATLITGIGGDELLGGWRLRRDVGQLRLALAPAPFRRRAHRRRARSHYPWLRPAALREFLRRRAEEKAAEPARFDKRTLWWPGRRGPAGMKASFERLAAASGSRAAHPLLDPQFVAAVAAHYGPLGARDRTAVWDDLFADLLPPALVRRESKAPFTDVLKHSHSVDFVNTLGADDVPSDVDPEGMRRVWVVPLERRLGLLVQALWLVRSNGRAGR